MNKLKSFQEDLDQKLSVPEDDLSYLIFTFNDQEFYLLSLDEIQQIGSLKGKSKIGLLKEWFDGITSIDAKNIVLINLSYLLTKKNTEQKNLVVLKDAEFKSVGFACKVIGIVNFKELVNLNKKEKYIKNTFQTDKIYKEINIQELFPDLKGKYA